MEIELFAWLREKVETVLDERNWSMSAISDHAVKVSNRANESVVVAIQPDVEGLDSSDPLLLISDDTDASSAKYFNILPREATAQRVIRNIEIGHQLWRLRHLELTQDEKLERREIEVAQLIEIGKSFGIIHDVDQLLNIILEKARFLVGADAGSIYIIEGDADEPEQRRLRFKLSQNDSITYESKEFVMPVSMESIAGAAVMMRQSINIGDVAQIPADAPYHFDPAWDVRSGYHTKSVLAVPMINLANEVLGVVQLINKKRNPQALLKTEADVSREVIPMDPRSQELAETLASQAGVAMENSFLYAEIQRIFEGFVHASVHAIEQRDPTTSGHSVRVSALTRRLAEVADGITEGPYADFHLTAADLHEIEIAALLHDFGKVGVREEILVKAKKLYPPSLKMIRARFDFVRRSIENDYLHRRIMMIEQGTPTQELAILDQASKRAVEQIDECWRAIWSANEPTVLPHEDFKKIEEIANRSYFDVGGKRQPYLTDEEVTALKVAKGSLTSEELDEIRSHVVHTISFLEQIPWGKSLRNIPKYAGAHHEKINGSGYPNGLKGDEIPIASRIMAVADIFDALTARDRPYKKAVPLEQALHILQLEADSKHIDTELVQLFKATKVYEVLNGMNIDDK